MQECDHPSITASGVLQGKATQALVDSKSVRLVLSLLNPSCISKMRRKRRNEGRKGGGKEEGCQYHLLALHQETRNCTSFKEEQLAQPINGGK